MDTIDFDILEQLKNRLRKGRFITSLPGEEWKELLNFNPIFEISSLGRIFRKDRIIFNKGLGLYCLKKGGLIKPQIASNGYLKTTLWKVLNGKKVYVNKTIHSLVAEYFCYKPEGLTNPEVNHINGIRSDPRALNLEWCSRSHNVIDSFKRKKYRCGPHSGTNALSVSDVNIICLEYDRGVLQKDLAARFGVTQPCISAIVRNKTYTASKIKGGRLLSKKGSAL